MLRIYSAFASLTHVCCMTDFKNHYYNITNTMNETSPPGSESAINYHFIS